MASTEPKPKTTPVAERNGASARRGPRRAPVVARGAGGGDPDLEVLRTALKAAITELAPMLETHQHADVYNLMGFSLRKSGDPKQAYTFYRKALDFDPEHKGALEYLGELYVETGQVDKARENVVLLKKLCPSGCEELADLEQAVASASPKASVVSPTNN